MSIKPLKVDFHLHTREDPHDFIAHDSYRLVDMMASKGYDAIAITNHDMFTWSDRLRDYAKERGVIVFRSVERTIRGRHVILVNFDGSLGDYRSLTDISRAKRPDNLVIAAHPYFPMPTASGFLLERRPEVFDAMEYCHYYVRNINFNKKAVIRSYTLGLPLVGNSDAHTVRQIGRTYSLVHSEKEPGAIIEAIKDNMVEVVSSPYKAATLLKITCLIPYRNIRGRMKCLIKTGRYGYRGTSENEFV